MSTFELAKRFIIDRKYQIVDEDNAAGYIAFRFQLNTIRFWANGDDDHFFFLTLPGFTGVTAENMVQVKEKCHQINKDAKLVKLYIMHDIIWAAAELYYLAKKDFDFQMLNALKHLVAAKVMYKKLEE